MPLRDTHKDYDKYIDIWQRNRAAIGGEDYIKGRLGDYSSFDFLPDVDDPTTPNRYKKYLERAVYYNYSGWTWQGLLGAIFRKSKEYELPSNIEYVEYDIDGSGQGLIQHCRETTGQVLEVGRVGLLVDYPQLDSPVPADQQAPGAYLVTYKAEECYNWKYGFKAGKLVLEQVRIKEVVEEEIDEFTTKPDERIRVLDLDDAGYYRQRLFGKDDKQIDVDIYPKDAKGNKWREIPFVFIGSEDNRPSVDIPPLNDIVNINIGHYHNSADHEELLYVHGQGTIFVWCEMSGEQFKAANPNGVVVGARTGHFLGPNGGAILLQTKADGALPDAMDRKVQQMVGIGARFIADTGKNQTAEAARIGASQQTSGLNTLVSNVEDAYKLCLKWMARFMGGEEQELVFELNRDFYDKSLTPQEVVSLMMLKDGGIIAKSDVRKQARRTGYLDADRTDEEIEEEISTNGE